MKKHNYVFDLYIYIYIIYLFIYLSEISSEIHNKIINILFDVREIFPLVTHCFCFPPNLSLHRLSSLFFPSSLLLGLCSELSLETHKSLTFFPSSPSMVFISLSDIFHIWSYQYCEIGFVKFVQDF